MPSFDVVSEVDKHEAQNAVDQANRELATRFDFRGVQAGFELKDLIVTMTAEHEFQIDQMKPMLTAAMINRNIKTSCLEYSKVQGSGKKVKVSKLKVQASIQGETVRIQGKSRDDLQQVMAMFKKDESIEMPLAFKNFKD